MPVALPRNAQTDMPCCAGCIAFVGAGMLRGGHRASHREYSHVLRAMANAGKYGDAMALLDRMRSVWCALARRLIIRKADGVTSSPQHTCHRGNVTVVADAQPNGTAAGSGLISHMLVRAKLRCKQLAAVSGDMS